MLKDWLPVTLACRSTNGNRCKIAVIDRRWRMGGKIGKTKLTRKLHCMLSELQQHLQYQLHA